MFELSIYLQTIIHGRYLLPICPTSITQWPHFLNCGLGILSTDSFSGVKAYGIDLSGWKRGTRIFDRLSSFPRRKDYNCVYWLHCQADPSSVSWMRQFTNYSLVFQCSHITSPFFRGFCPHFRSGAFLQIPFGNQTWACWKMDHRKFGDVPSEINLDSVTRDFPAMELMKPEANQRRKKVQ